MERIRIHRIVSQVCSFFDKVLNFYFIGQIINTGQYLKVLKQMPNFKSFPNFIGRLILYPNDKPFKYYN